MEIIFSYSKNTNLLYVEDNEQARTFTLELLNRFFDNVTIAHDGEDGVKKFKDNDIDLIITDVNMPKMCGIEMSTEIKKLNTKVPILLLSAHNEIEFVNAAYNVGVYKYMQKPLNFLELMNVLTNLALSPKNTKVNNR